MSGVSRLLIEKASLIRSINALLSLNNENAEVFNLTLTLITDIENSLSNIAAEFNSLAKVSNLFDQSNLEGEKVVIKFFATFITSIILESISLSNNNISVKLPVLSSLVTDCNPSLELFFKLLDSTKNV